MRMIDADKAIEIIEEKQKELCPVGRYGRNYVYGSDREKYDSWEEIIDALEALPTLTPPNEWISVEEKLPENGQVVLFYQRDGFIYCAEYFAGNALMSPGWFIDNDSWDAKEVTHWMPIPAPPKKERDHE